MPGSYLLNSSSLGVSAKRKRATPKQIFILLVAILVPFATCFCAFAAAPLAAAAVSMAPEKVASITGSILCPANTATSKLVTLYGNYSTSNTTPYAHYTSRDYTNVIKCFDAQGVELPGKGDSFTALWWGSWIVVASIVGALVTFNLLFALYKLNQAHALAPQEIDESVRVRTEKDEELEKP